MSQPTLDDYIAADHAAFVNQIAAWLREGFEQDDEPRQVTAEAA